jgi:hypothetical protein
MGQFDTTFPDRLPSIGYMANESLTVPCPLRRHSATDGSVSKALRRRHFGKVGLCRTMQIAGGICIGHVSINRHKYDLAVGQAVTPVVIGSSIRRTARFEVSS